VSAPGEPHVAIEIAAAALTGACARPDILIPPVFSNDNGTLMLSGRRFETCLVRPVEAAASSLRPLTLGLGLLLSILLLNLRGLLLLDNLTAG
jgi:hypothetical protein